MRWSAVARFPSRPFPCARRESSRSPSGCARSSVRSARTATCTHRWRASRTIITTTRTRTRTESTDETPRIPRISSFASPAGDDAVGHAVVPRVDDAPKCLGALERLGCQTYLAALTAHVQHVDASWSLCRREHVRRELAALGKRERSQGTLQ